MEKDMNNTSAPIRPERLMKAINDYSKDDAYTQSMLVLQLFGVHVT